MNEDIEMSANDVNYYKSVVKPFGKGTVTYGKFILMNSLAMDNKPKIQQRLSKIAKKCNFIYKPKETKEKTYYLLYCPKEKTVEGIASYLQLIYRKGEPKSFLTNWFGSDLYFWAIYNACSIKNRSGFLTELRKTVNKIVELNNEAKIHKDRNEIITHYNKLFPDTSLFFTTPYILGVEIDNPMFGAVVRTYIKLGFRNARYGVYGDKHLIVLDTLPSKNLNKDFIYRDAKFLASRYYEVKQEKIYVKLDPSMITYFQKKIQFNFGESGGAFINTTTKMIGDKKVIMLKDVVVSTEDSNECKVDIIPQVGLFRYHTHPLQCYENYGTHMGWPSDMDFYNALFNANINGDLYYSFVMSKEKLYYYYVNPSFVARSLGMSRKCKDAIGIAVKAYFNVLLHFRNKNLKYSEKFLLEQLKIINSMTVSSMMQAIRKHGDKMFGEELIRSYKIAEPYLKGECNRVNDIPIFKFGYNKKDIKEEIFEFNKLA